MGEHTIESDGKTGLDAVSTLAAENERLRKERDALLDGLKFIENSRLGSRETVTNMLARIRNEARGAIARAKAEAQS